MSAYFDGIERNASAGTSIVELWPEDVGDWAEGEGDGEVETGPLPNIVSENAE